MNEITIIGLGVDGYDLSTTAQSIIKSSVKIIARTGLTKSYENLSSLGKKIDTLDFIYEKSRNFDTLNKNLGNEVIKIAKNEPVCYLVDGCATEDNSVKYILSKCKNVKVYAGVSYATKCLERLGVCESNYTAISSYEVGDSYTLSAPLIVYAIDSAVTASKIKLFLLDVFGEEIKVKLSSNGGNKEIYLYELDRQKSYDYSTCLYIPKLPLIKKQRFDFNDLLSILEILRSPNGCPWDREQTEKSILKNVVEEAYELVDAVNSGDDFMIIEETGDLILQSAFYIAFGEEGSRFSRYDVLSDLCKKLITRHTHVFGQDKAVVSNDALSVWNNNKIVEKGYETATEYLNAVPTTMPSLMRAEKIGKRAGKYGFDFENSKTATDKILEEIKELTIAVDSGNKEEIQKECGDLLFSAVNVVRLLGVDAELSLKYSVDKFINRFSKVESVVLAKGKKLTDFTLLELDEIYNQIKGVKDDN
jgi:tetrapyrrole methylase family protein/MazG family protein